MPSVKAPDQSGQAAAPPKKKKKAEPVSDEQQALLTAEIEKSEKLAASQLHMADLFLKMGKTEIAKRRLELLVETLPQSAAAQQAKKLLKTM